MTPTTTFIRNIRGDRELEQPGETARELMDILAAVDGKASIDELAARLTHRGRSSLEKGLEVLVAGKFIRDAAGPIPYGEPGFVDRRQSGSGGQADQQRRAEDLRAKLKARREGADRLAPGAGTAEGSGPAPAPAPASGGAAEQSRKATEDLSRVAAEAQARRAAEEQSRKLVEEQARRAAEDLARRAAEDAARRAAEDAARRAAEEQARKAAEEQARKAAEEQARKVAEEQARKLAEAQARKAAEDAARRAAEEQARKLAEEQARKLAVEQARKAAEDAARKAAEEKARQEEEAEAREAAERARQRAEVQARLMAEEKAWQEAEEKARRDEEAKLREQAAAAEIKAAGPRRPRKLGPAVAMAVVALLVLGLAAIHLLSFDAQIPPLEQALSAQFQQPVKIRSLHMALLPSPHMRLEGVAIGAQGQVRIAKVKAAGDLGNLFNEKKAFRSVELDSAAIGEEALGWILFDGRQPGAIPFGRISATNATLDSKRITLPAFDAQVELEGGGAWKTIALVSADKNMELLLTAKPGSALVEAKARSFKLPFGSTLTLEDFVASGTADPAGLNLADFKGFALGGTVAGTARLKWGGSWSLAGNLNVKQIDTARVVPELMASSRLAGTATYAMQGTDPTRLFASTRLDGSFTVVRGALRGIDLGNLLQGGDIRGETRFEELAGSVSRDGGVLQFRQLRLSQANMAATGSIDVSGDGSVQGRVTADIRLSTEQRRASLVVSGNLGRLEWRR